MVVLQLRGAPADRLKGARGNPTIHLQLAVDRDRNHSLCRSLASSILVVSRCRRALGGARPGSRSHDGVALGEALWPGTGTADAAASQAH